MCATRARPAAVFGATALPYIYDFELPRDIFGAPTPPVCKGFQRKKGNTEEPLSCAECLSNCLHPKKSEIVCVYGFWGLRHRVEQLILDNQEAPKPLRSMGAGDLAFTMGLSGRYVDEIPGKLKERIGETARQIADPPEDFLPTLWTSRRPTVLLLVGHYRTGNIVNEPVGPRLTLADNRFLQPEDILRPDNWDDPHSIVLLAACSGIVIDIANSNNFVNNFSSVGAGAVIGPEAIIYEGAARRFAVDVSAALVDGKTVGEAILAFRRGLLQDLNPLGLMFTAYGFADLHAPKH